MQNVFAIQSDVAQMVAQSLQAKLSPAEKARIETIPTTSLTAYDFAIKGREFYNLRTKENNENAIKLFKKALELDPEYALAWGGLGLGYARRPRYGFERTWADSAIKVAQRAIALRPNEAEGYAALANGYGRKGMGDKAFEANLKAVELNATFYISLLKLIS